LAAGLRPDPLGSKSVPPNPLAAISGPTSKGRQREGREGREEERERKGRERGKGREGKEAGAPQMTFFARRFCQN